RASINRSPSQVWAAVTEAEQLRRWLGTDVAIEPSPGGTFTLRTGTPLLSGEHRVTAVDPESAIEFEWRVDGFATDVRWEIHPRGETTEVIIRHTIDASAPFEVDDEFGGECGVFKELWAYVAGLLKTYLELGEAKCRLDPDRTPSSTISHELTVARDAAIVFEALTVPEKIKGWNQFAPKPEVERRVGGNYSYGWKSEVDKTDGPGEIVEYEEGHKVTYTWYGTPPTIVSWTVEPLPDDPSRTKIRFTHSGFDVDQNMLVGWNLGWAGFLFGLALHLELALPPDWFGEAA
ncbi:MAG: SRPBCC family protein, partial [Myxococcota bacterium]